MASAERRDVPHGTTPATEAEMARFCRELARLVAIASERRAKMAAVEQRGTELERR